MPRRLDIPDNTLTQSSKHTFIHSKFKIYLTDLNELLLVKSPIAIVVQSCKKFPRSFSFSHAIIKIGKHHYRFHSIKWKKKGLSPGSKLCIFLSGSRSSFRIVSNTFIEAKITNYSSEWEATSNSKRIQPSSFLSLQLLQLQELLLSPFFPNCDQTYNCILIRFTFMAFKAFFTRISLSTNLKTKVKKQMFYF